jgi:hypothetical protein
MDTPSKILIRVLILCSVLFSFAFPAVLRAQTDPALETGLKPFGTYQGSNIDFVNTTTGKVHVHIPLLSYPQRGGRLHADYFITYDSASYTCETIQNQHLCATTQVNNVFQQQGAWVQNNAALLSTSTDIYNDPPNDTEYRGTLVTVTDPDGATHRMGAIPASGSTTQMRAVDGSGYYMNTSNWSYPTIYDANGNSYNTSTHTMQDAIGNQMTAIPGGAVTDTIGRQIPATNSNDQQCEPWQVPGQDGGTVTYQLCFYAATTLPYTLSSIKLPNGTSYTFTYQETQITSPYDGEILELTEIGLPTGGTISYQWETVDSGCGTLNYYRTVTKRTLTDGDGDSWFWTYSLSTTSKTFTVTDPLGNVAVHTFTNLGTTTLPCSLYETQYQQKNSSGTVLRTINTSYQSTPDPGSTDYTQAGQWALSVVPTSITTTLDSGAQSTTTKNYPTNTFSFYDLAAKPPNSSYPNSQASALYVGNPSSVCVNDYGAGTGCTSSTSQETAYTYLAFQNGNYLNNNQLNLKSQVQVTSSSGQQFYDHL